MAQSNISVEVTRVRQLTERVKEYLLTSVDGRFLPEYGPGSHVAVHTVSPKRGLVVRHYSLIGGSDTEPDSRTTYRIAVQRDSDTRGSAHIHATFALGTRLEIAPPKNNFPLDRKAGPILLIAGGIGITPIFAMARSLARRQRPFKVVYAGRNRDSMAYQSELARLAAGSATFHYSDEAGVLNLTKLLREQPDGTTVYVCGPGAMIAAAHAAGKELGWNPDRVRSEAFGTAQTGDANAFDVRLLRSGRTVRVSADASILDALNAAGVPVLWDCRRGECGLCPLPVVSSDGPLQHNDLYLTEEEKAAGDTMCICVSRTKGHEIVLDA